MDSQDQFLSDIWRAIGMQESCISTAIAVHRAIAALAGRDPKEVSPKHKFEDKIFLGTFWDSLDTVAIQFELERQLGRELSDAEMESIPHPDLHPGLTVKDFVEEAVRVLSRSATS